MPPLADYPQVPAIINALAGFLQVEPRMVGALLIAGTAGAFAKALYQPEPGYMKRLRHGLAGALSAIFIGGLFGHILNRTIGGETLAFLAAGFLLGEGGLVLVYVLRDTILMRKGPIP